MQLGEQPEMSDVFQIINLFMLIIFLLISLSFMMKNSELLTIQNKRIIGIFIILICSRSILYLLLYLLMNKELTKQVIDGDACLPINVLIGFHLTRQVSDFLEILMF